MPIYEYRCKHDHVTPRLFLSPNAATEAAESIYCPQCAKTRRGARTLARRAVSQTGAPILKRGTGGFYKPTQ